MERLTERDEFGNANIIGVDSMDLQCNLEFKKFNKVTNALNKLAEYETLEEKNLLLKLPCKVGSSVYWVNDWFYDWKIGLNHEWHITEAKVSKIKIDDITSCMVFTNGINVETKCFGETVFLTKAEAEEVLNRMKGEERHEFFKTD